MVDTFLSTLVSAIASEVKHIPDVSRPDVRSLVDGFEHLLMVDCLIFFSIVKAFWMRGVEVRHTFRSVFA